MAKFIGIFGIFIGGLAVGASLGYGFGWKQSDIILEMYDAVSMPREKFERVKSMCESLSGKFSETNQVVINASNKAAENKKMIAELKKNAEAFDQETLDIERRLAEQVQLAEELKAKCLP